MDKVRDFLEKHVQWVALGLGALWVLYQIWANVVNGPAAELQVANRPVGPGSVDQRVHEEVAVRLRDQMQRTDTPRVTVQRYANTVIDQLALNGANVPALDRNYVASRAGSAVGGGIDPGTTTVARPKLERLPVPPVLVDVSTTTGMSIAAAANAGGNPGVPAAGQQRVLWVSVFARLPMADLVKAFEEIEKAMPENFVSARQTMLLRVEWQREELLPNGQWGKAVSHVSEPIDLGNPPAGGAAAPGGPGGAAPPWPQRVDFMAEQAYGRWAAASQRLIAQPAFYQIVRGDGWHKPGEQPVQVGAPVINPANQPPAEPPPVAQPPRGPRQPNQPRPGTPPRRTPSDRSTVPNDRTGPAGRTSSLLGTDVRVRTMNTQSIFDAPAPPPAGNPNAPFGGAPGAGAAPAGPVNVAGEPPTAPFIPRNAADINIWAHDVSVESGKTYRYALRYTISNPAWQMFGNVANKQLADTFAIDAKSSAWSSPVTVRSTTTYYLTNFVQAAGGSIGRAVFEVFTWNVGGVTQRKAELSPGDQIDEAVRLTFVDIRDAGFNDRLVILVDDAGNIVERRLKADANDPELANLRRQAQSPVAPLP